MLYLCVFPPVTISDISLSDRKDYCYKKKKAGLFLENDPLGGLLPEGHFPPKSADQIWTFLTSVTFPVEALVSFNDPKQKHLQLFSSNDTKGGLKIPPHNSHPGRWAQVMLDIDDNNTWAYAGLTVKHLKLYFTHSRQCLLPREWQGFTYFLP